MTPEVPEAAARALLTVSGADRPGVTARLFAALAEGAPAVEVLDVEQVVVHGQLVLGVVVGVLATGAGPAVGHDELLERLRPLAAAVAADVGLRVDVEAADAGPASVPAGRPHHVILLGRPVAPAAVAVAPTARRARGQARPAADRSYEPAAAPLPRPGTPGPLDTGQVLRSWSCAGVGTVCSLPVTWSG